jgi:hypothetical protein
MLEDWQQGKFKFPLSHASALQLISRHSRTWWAHGVAVGFGKRVGLKSTGACGWKQEVMCDNLQQPLPAFVEACTIFSALLNRPS